MVTAVCARYKNVDGWHVFQSDELPGLYVASRDAEKAFHDVPLSIQTLVLLDEGIECIAVPEMSFPEFIASIKENRIDSPAANDPVVLSSKRYVLTSVAA